MSGDFTRAKRELGALTDAQLAQRLSEQLRRNPTGRPTYYVAYEYIDGSYRPVAAADKAGVVNVSFDGAIYSSWTDEENMTWLRNRVNDLVRLGKVR